MTIAVCHVSSEGVILGADSTSTMFVGGPHAGGGGTRHHYNFGQKVFEFGEKASLGIVTWGLGALGPLSYRTLVAEVADGLSDEDSFEAVVTKWVERFWAEYTNCLGPPLERARELARKQHAELTAEEQRELLGLLQLGVGFCVGGHRPLDRRPKAFEITFDPRSDKVPVPLPIPLGSTRFWGSPNIINRMLLGIDPQLVHAILASGKWSGAPEELFALVAQTKLGQPVQLPLREAIDWVYASIYATIKTLKFSHLPVICGGPIEIAVISSDRLFRWVRHKRFDEAIG